MKGLLQNCTNHHEVINLEVLLKKNCFVLILQGLEGSLNESDFHLKEQLKFLYEAFVMFCGSFQNIHEVLY